MRVLFFFLVCVCVCACRVLSLSLSLSCVCFQKASSCARFASKPTVDMLEVSVNPQPSRHGAYASMPSSSSSGIKRRYSRQEMSKPCTRSMGGPLAFDEGFVLRYVIVTGPVLTSDGSVSSMDCMDERAATACRSEIAATADGDTQEGSALETAVLQLPMDGAAAER